MSKISFIYFDVGGVAIKDFSDSNKWDEMIDNALGIPKEYHAAFNKLYDEYEDDICIGKIAVDDLQPFIKERFQAKFPNNFSMLSYFVDHFEPNPDLWQMVETIPSNLKLGLLTDQYLGMLDMIFAKQLIPRLSFTSLVDSSILGTRKPALPIYEFAELQANVPPSEILFIDNREKNLVPARARGWQTYLYDSKTYDLSNQKLSEYFSANL